MRVWLPVCDLQSDNEHKSNRRKNSREYSSQTSCQKKPQQQKSCDKNDSSGPPKGNGAATTTTAAATTTTIVLPPPEAGFQVLGAIDHTQAISEPKEVDCTFLEPKLPSEKLENGKNENLEEPLLESDISFTPYSPTSLEQNELLQEEKVEPWTPYSDIKKRLPEELLHNSDWKRFKVDSKPAAMAIGERLKRKNDDEDEDDELKHLWLLEPAENEPPSFSNNPAVASYPGPEDDTEDEDTDDDDRRSKSSSDGPQGNRTNDTIPKFQNALKKQGLELVEQEGDGNCLFRAVSLQVYGNADNHGEVRELCMDYMARNEEHYSNFIVASSDEEDSKSSVKDPNVTPFQAYVARKRRDGIHGNHAEIQAISELFNRPVEVYTPDNPDGKPMNIFHSEYKTSDPPIRLSYHDGNHYNAIVDPLVPTAGLGLGLPGLQPGLADKLQLAKAKAESDQLADDMELQRVLKESQEEYKDFQQDSLQRALKDSSYDLDYIYKQKALALSDLDETNYEIEQKVLANSIESYIRQEQCRKQRASPRGSNQNRRRRSPSPNSAKPPATASGCTSVDSSSAYAAIPSVASAAAAAVSPPEAAAASPEPARMAVAGPSISAGEEYPQTVQELVMNGFELRKVIHAYELIGDNFDDLLSFLLSSTNSS